jgi:hypothetical protein
MNGFLPVALGKLPQSLRGSPVFQRQRINNVQDPHGWSCLLGSAGQANKFHAFTQSESAIPDAEKMGEIVLRCLLGLATLLNGPRDLELNIQTMPASRQMGA